MVLLFLATKRDRKALRRKYSVGNILPLRKYKLGDYNMRAGTSATLYVEPFNHVSICDIMKADERILY